MCPCPIEGGKNLLNIVKILCRDIQPDIKVRQNLTPIEFCFFLSGNGRLPSDGHRIKLGPMGQGEVIDGKIRAVNKKVAKRDHGRRFSAVIRTHENCRLLGEVYPYGLKLSKVADLDMSNVHGVSLYVPARRLLGQRG